MVTDLALSVRRSCSHDGLQIQNLHLLKSLQVFEMSSTNGVHTRVSNLAKTCKHRISKNVINIM